MLNDGLHALAPVIRTDAFILGVAALLIAWAAWSGWWFRRQTREVALAFRAAAQFLGSDPDPVAFAARYEEASERLGGEPLLGAAWRGWSHTFIVPETDGRPVFATVEPAAWFDLGHAYRSAGSDLRYHAALPGLLVGAGLLFTFLGLAVGLAAASDVVAEGVDQLRRNAALRDLLGAASVKFVTSLVGLGLSICYALFRKAQLRQAERAQTKLLEALRDRLPLRLPAALQAEANALAERQFTELQRINNDFFVNLGSILEEKFGQGLEQHIGPLSEAIAALSDRLGKQNEGALETMLHDFVQKLQGETGRSMTGAAERIEALAGQMSGLESGMKDAAGNLSEAAAKISYNLADGTRGALNEVTREVASLVATLKEVAAETGRNNAAAGEAQRQAAEAAARELAEVVRRAASGLEATSATISETMGTGAADASRRLVEATEGMRDELRGVLQRFGATLEATGSTLAEGAAAGSESLRGAAAGIGEGIAAVAKSLRAAGEAAGNALARGGEEAAQGIEGAAGMLRGSAGELGERMIGLGRSATDLSEGARALGQSAREAAVPLVASADALKDAGAAAREAVRPLLSVADAIGSASSGLGAAATAMSDAQKAAGTLGTQLATTAQRFDGMDEALAATLAQLTRGLDGYQQQITTFVRDMDSGLAKSVGNLGAIVNQLQETIEERDEAPRRPSGRFA